MISCLLDLFIVGYTVGVFMLIPFENVNPNRNPSLDPIAALGSYNPLTQQTTHNPIAQLRYGQSPSGQLGQVTRYAPQVKEIPDGYHGTAATIKEMQKLARAASIDPKFVSWCRSIVADLPPKDYYGEAKRIYDVVKKHVRYVLDPRGMEMVQDPRHVIFVEGQEDCDGHATTIAAIALALGHGAAFKTVAVDPDRPDEFSHVYPLIGIQKGMGEEWIAADTTQKSGYFGWEPPASRITKQKVWPV